jgi:hypothetical protein
MAGKQGWQPHSHLWADCLDNMGSLQPYRPPWPVAGIVLLYIYMFPSSGNIKHTSLVIVLPNMDPYYVHILLNFYNTFRSILTFLVLWRRWSQSTDWNMYQRLYKTIHLYSNTEFLYFIKQLLCLAANRYHIETQQDANDKDYLMTPPALIGGMITR